jgi:endonuclease/exonuclease/phosphatase family metal-dependent hydrolase
VFKASIILFFIIPSISNAQDTLSIVSWNTYLLPKYVKKSNQENRAKDICNILIKNNYDIIALQEVFDKASLKIIIDSLSPKYPYYKIGNKKSLLKLSSGLITFSKCKITNSNFTKYKKAISADFFAKKGALTCQLKINNTKTIKVVNTHLQSTDKKAAKKIRIKQLNRISNSLKADTIYPTVFLGDFNIAKRNDNYTTMLSILNASDNKAINDSIYTCNSPSNNLVTNNESPSIFDYILKMKSEDIKIIERKYYEPKNKKGVCLSDHNLVEGLIILK